MTGKITNFELVRGMRARSLTAKRIKNGSLIRPDTCSICNIVCKPIAHHPDYNRPEYIVFVCNGCHMVEHGRRQPRK